MLQMKQILLVLTVFVCYYKKHDVAVPFLVRPETLTIFLGE